jgi:hypothetical protein
MSAHEEARKRHTSRRKDERLQAQTGIRFEYMIQSTLEIAALSIDISKQMGCTVALRIGCAGGEQQLGSGKATGNAD